MASHYAPGGRSVNLAISKTSPASRYQIQSLRPPTQRAQQDGIVFTEDADHDQHCTSSAPTVAKGCRSASAVSGHGADLGASDLQRSAGCRGIVCMPAEHRAPPGELPRGQDLRERSVHRCFRPPAPKRTIPPLFSMSRALPSHAFESRPPRSVQACPEPSSGTLSRLYSVHFARTRVRRRRGRPSTSRLQRMP